jgi:hypothetical protein
MAGASDGRSVSQYLPRSEPRTLWALAPFSEIYVDLSRRCVGWIRAVLSKNRLCGIFALWTWVCTATDSNGIARYVTSVGGESPAVTQRRGAMGHQPLRLRASAGVFASWTWLRSATDSNGIARCVTSTGGDSPAGPGFMPIRYEDVLARSLPQPTRLWIERFPTPYVGIWVGWESVGGGCGGRF